MKDISIASLDAYIQKHIEGKRPSPPVLRAYRDRLHSHDFSVMINDGNMDECRNAVVFIEDRPGYFFHKQSVAWQKQGFKTVLLTRWGVSQAESEFYDRIVLYDRFSDLKLLSTVQARVFYVQSWVGWSFLPVYIDLIVAAPVYCNINDLTTLILEDPQKGPMFSLAEEDVAVDLQCERYILDHIEKVTLPYRMEKLRDMGDYTAKSRANWVLFPSYPSGQYIQNISRELTGAVRLLFVGGIPPDSLPDQVFSDAKMHNVIDDLLRDDLHVSFFLNPMAVDRSSNAIEALYPFFTNVAAQNSRFVIQKGYFPWILHRHTAQFHFGLMVYSFDDVEISERHIRTILPSKIFTYLELGLPIIVVEEMECVSDFVQQQGVGIVISRDEIACLSEVIERNRPHYQTYIKNIRTYCAGNSMEQMVREIFPSPESDALYEQVQY